MLESKGAKGSAEEISSILPHEDDNLPNDFDPKRRKVVTALTSSAVLAAMIACGAPLPQPTETTPEINPIDEEPDIPESLFTPETVHGVEVYGLRSPLDSDEKMQSLYDFFDAKFLIENDIPISEDVLTNRNEIRKEHLSPNKRFLEVVITQSAYKEFLLAQDETGVDFVEWEKAHVDLLNILMENAKPKTDMRASIRRILIVDDTYVASFWAKPSLEKSKDAKETQVQLDLAWARKFKDRYPLDIDSSWAIASDYRDSLRKFLWKASKLEDNLILLERNNTQYSTRNKFTYPIEEYAFLRSLLIREASVDFDIGQIHEWSHFLLNTPDESRQNVDGIGPYRFKNFFFETGNFQVPWVSPFISMILTRNMNEKLRNPWGKDSMVFNYDGRPSNIGISFERFNNANGNINLRVYPLHIKGTNGPEYLTSVRSFSETPDGVSSDVLINLGSNVFEKEGTLIPPVVLFTLDEGENHKEIYMPAAAFIMSDLAGVDNANYEVEFFELDDAQSEDDKNLQAVYLVDESDYVDFYNTSVEKGDTLYAKMIVPGTSTIFVWKLEERDYLPY